MGCENAYNSTKMIGSRNLMQRYLFLALCELEHGDGVSWRRISARTGKSRSWQTLKLRTRGTSPPLLLHPSLSRRRRPRRRPSHVARPTRPPFHMCSTRIGGVGTQVTVKRHYSGEKTLIIISISRTTTVLVSKGATDATRADDGLSMTRAHVDPVQSDLNVGAFFPFPVVVADASSTDISYIFILRISISPISHWS